MKLGFWIDEESERDWNTIVVVDEEEAGGKP